MLCEAGWPDCLLGICSGLFPMGYRRKGSATFSDAQKLHSLDRVLALQVQNISTVGNNTLNNVNTLQQELTLGSNAVSGEASAAFCNCGGAFAAMQLARFESPDLAQVAVVNMVLADSMLPRPVQ